MSSKEIKLNIQLHPRQQAALNSLATEKLYGGAAGGGKSFYLRWRGIAGAFEVPGLQVYLIRRQATDLVNNHIEGPSGFPVLLAPFIDAGIVKIVYSPNIDISFKNGPLGGFEGGSRIFLRHCKDESSKYNFQGSEIHLLLIDELTLLTEGQYRFIRSRVRLGGLKIPPEVPVGKYPCIECGSNPGNVGHYFVKFGWIVGHAPMEIWRTPKRDGGLLRQFIPAKLEDNPTLLTVDPDYADRLEGLGDPALVKAMRDGDWDTFQGQAFPFSQNYHVVSPEPVPTYAQLYMTFDWGYGAPFSVGWWWVDSDGRLFRFAEWYGWNGNPNQGLRMTDTEIALGIKEREERLGVAGRNIIRLAGPDCFSKKPDYLGGGQGPSTSEMFSRQGINLSPGDADRKKKIRQFYERLRVPKDGSAPMLQVYSVCTQFIRTIPDLVFDENNVEDLASNLEDHIYDEACHACMARPIEMVLPKSKKTKEAAMLDMLEQMPASDVEEAQGFYGDEEKQMMREVFGGGKEEEYGMYIPGATNENSWAQ